MLCAAFYGCARCDQGEVTKAIATLTKLAGPGVTRDFAAHVQDWQKAEEGARLSLGDGAQTDASSTAELRFVNGSGLTLKPNTIVRLLPDEVAKLTGFDIQAGEAIFRTGSGGIKLRTHVGLAEIEPDTEVALRRDGDTLAFAVALGRVAFRDHERAEVLNAGDSMSVGIGMAVLELKRKAGVEEEEPNQIVVEVLGGEARAGAGAGRPLPKGVHTVSANTRLRLAEGAEVVVKRGQERVRLRGAGEFTVGVPNAIAESKRGAMLLEALQVDVEVHVPGGVIIARGGQGGSSADVTVGATDGSLHVLKGNVTAQVAGLDRELNAGQDLGWQLGEGGETSDESTSAGPDYRNMSARAGESFVVHSPSAPVAIGFDFAGRCEEGQLELVNGRQAQRGTGSANLLFPAGTRTYTLRCASGGGLGKVVGRGTVQVVIDAGTRKLPARAPTSNVEADGRTYSIYYQNQLPEVIARWPNAPAQKAYKLDLDGKTIDLTEPQYLFKSGSLSDGTHALSFQAEGRRSRTTTVEVHFDNVAPKAALSGPDDRAFNAGDAITVEGVALPTWKVALEGGTIDMSSGDRFSGHVQTSAERPDIAVRLSHPRLGTHYYLRRASGSP
ncbi:MAG TPA: FecR domain-containing protein [Polyangiales bacterium]|nr:FecR domain-containing protein [Polyangiales bacterium]